VQIEPDAQLILNKTTGPVRIHMRTLTRRGKVVEAGPYYGQPPCAPGDAPVSHRDDRVRDPRADAAQAGLHGATGEVACRSRLGGILNYCHREAA